jgi:hypothetical protein
MHLWPCKTAHEQYNSSDSALKRKFGYEQAPASVGSTHTDDLDLQSMTVRKLILSDQRNKGESNEIQKAICCRSGVAHLARLALAGNGTEQHTIQYHGDDAGFKGTEKWDDL